MRVAIDLPPVERKKIEIGKRIAAYMKKHGIEPIAVYTKMRMPKPSFFKYRGKNSLDTDLLQRFSDAIGYNFFREFVPEIEAKEKEVQQLRKQLDDCKKQLSDTKDKLLQQYESNINTDQKKVSVN